MLQLESSPRADGTSDVEYASLIHQNYVLYLVLLSLLSLLIPQLSSLFTKTLISLVIKIISIGPIPNHIAFIMDGNRRFAKNRGHQIKAGHLAGFQKLEATLNWCTKLNIKAVTVYAFSIENFKRPTSEVSDLMKLALEKFNEFANKSEFIRENNISIRVLGDLDLLDKDVRKAADDAMASTASHTGPILNICFPYTSIQEINSTIKTTKELISKNEIKLEDVTVELFDNLLYTKDTPTLDMIVRTSGEIRLSDFLLWQACSPGCFIYFLDILWPDFSFWNMLPVLISYQANYRNLHVKKH